MQRRGEVCLLCEATSLLHIIVEDFVSDGSPTCPLTQAGRPHQARQVPLSLRRKL
jgi:hypothetical protein